jgi:hypothetical protein
MAIDEVIRMSGYDTSDAAIRERDRQWTALDEHPHLHPGNLDRHLLLVRLTLADVENARLRDELAKERTSHTATRSRLNDALDNPIFED